MIRRSYSPPFQQRAPQLGADDIGRAIKSLVNVEVARTNEVQFAVESFGCDGKPVLSPMRGLPCETSGTLVVAGTKNGLPFKLNADLPRGIGSAIRGSGGGLVTVSGATAMRSREWVIYDNFGNHWSIESVVSGSPLYLGQTPPLASGGDGITPAVAVQAPEIRPYELRWEYAMEGGDPPAAQAVYLKGGAGWIEDSTTTPMILYPVAYPYADPADYWQIRQWLPDETTAPAGGEFAAGWPGMKRHVDIEWYPARSDVPQDWSAITENSVDVIVSKYGPTETRVYMNRYTRPLLESIVPGGISDEGSFLIFINQNALGAGSRIELRNRGTGALIASIVYSPPVGVYNRTAFTPDALEGWLLQHGTISSRTVTVQRYRSRDLLTGDIGSGLAWYGQLTVTLPAGPAVEWDAEPVWFRVGEVTRTFGSNPRLWPLLPRW